jgi:hypothetical protein
MLAVAARWLSDAEFGNVAEHRAFPTGTPKPMNQVLRYHN